MVFVPALIFFILILVAFAVKICREYERAFVFRLGRLILPPRGPGVFLIIPIIDRIVKISIRSEKDLEEAIGLLLEAQTTKDANVEEIEKHLRELAEVRKKLGFPRKL